jgi:phosphoserine aminotransferase
VVFTWNGTTSGVRVPDGDWIADDRAGLTFADATSAAFAQDLPFAKLDVTTFSWQKVLGGEGGHGMLILGPRAVERLESYAPSWPLPKIFRMTKGGKLNEGIFKGDTINTPSMLAVEDYIFALEWALGLGGLPALVARADSNAAAVDAWVQRTDWIEHLAADPASRSNTSVCLRFAEAGDPEAQAALVKKMASLLEAEGAAYDVASYRDAPPGLRLWCGATVETEDLEAVFPWLEWAFQEARSG